MSHAAFQLTVSKRTEGPIDMISRCGTDDLLNIDGTNYDGTSCPRGVTLSSRSTISWQSDGSVAGDGWEICAAGASDSSNSCRYANDGECDDGSTGGTQYCTRGTDANDCASGGAAASGGQFTVESGPCTTTQGGSCVGRLQYGDRETCEIRSNVPGSISSCPVFQTERGCKLHFSCIIVAALH